VHLEAIQVTSDVSRHLFGARLSRPGSRGTPTPTARSMAASACPAGRYLPSLELDLRRDRLCAHMVHELCHAWCTSEKADHGIRWCRAAGADGPGGTASGTAGAAAVGADGGNDNGAGGTTAVEGVGCGADGIGAGDSGAVRSAGPLVVDDGNGGGAIGCRLSPRSQFARPAANTRPTHSASHPLLLTTPCPLLPHTFGMTMPEAE